MFIVICRFDFRPKLNFGTAPAALKKSYNYMNESVPKIIISLLFPRYWYTLQHFLLLVNKHNIQGLEADWYIYKFLKPWAFQIEEMFRL